MGFTNKKIVLSITVLIVVATVLTATTYAALSTNRNLSTTGTVDVSANLGVYSDSACTTTLSTISWGNLTPGESTTQTIYVKNTGAGVSLSLSMATSSWNPSSANGPIIITWNRENTVLTPGQVTTATITLTVSSSITDVTNFSVQISITGEQ